MTQYQLYRTNVTDGGNTEFYNTDKKKNAFNVYQLIWPIPDLLNKVQHITSVHPNLTLMRCLISVLSGRDNIQRTEKFSYLISPSVSIKAVFFPPYLLWCSEICTFSVSKINPSHAYTLTHRGTQKKSAMKLNHKRSCWWVRNRLN